MSSTMDQNGHHQDTPIANCRLMVMVLMFIAYLSMMPVLIFANPPSRSQLATMLAAAEQKRSWFRVHIEYQFNYAVGKKAPGESKHGLDIVADGKGDFRINIPNKSGLVETDTWNNHEYRAQKFALSEDDHNSAFGSMGIYQALVGAKYTGRDIWSVLGLRIGLPLSDRTPLTPVSEVLANSDREATISEVSSGGKTLVKIYLPDPFGLGGNNPPAFTYYYDPSKDWLLVRFIDDDPGISSEQYDTRYSDEMRVLKSKSIDGVWMPTITKDIEMFHYKKKADEKYETTVRLTGIKLKPEVSDDDFTLRVSDLPNGVSVVDAGLNITYKKGQNLIYMNGHLNEVKQPIDHQIKPGELKNIMKDSIAFIDPVATANEAKLKTVTSKGRYASYTKWGFILLGLAFASMGIILWRKNHI